MISGMIRLSNKGQDDDAPAARYFAIVIRGDDTLGNVLCASTELGNWLRSHCQLPDGFMITRSIEISKGMAERTW